MQIVMGALLIALSLTMISFSQWNGYVPVSRPTHRVYRADRPSYYWTLIAGYAVVGAVGVFIVAQ